MPCFTVKEFALEADMQAGFLHIKHYCSDVVCRPCEAILILGFMMGQPGKVSLWTVLKSIL